MSLAKLIYSGPRSLVGIWKLDEPEEFFTIALSPFLRSNSPHTTIQHPQRRKEWLAGRFLIKTLMEQHNFPFSGTWTDEYDKPHLLKSQGYITISHAKPYVAAMVNLNSPCGIDVERYREKLSYLAPKFLTEKEQALAGGNLRNLAILWSAKEALYKLYGKRSLIFRENLHISDINFNENLGAFQGKIETKEARMKVTMFFRAQEEHVLVYTG